MSDLIPSNLSVGNAPPPACLASSARASIKNFIHAAGSPIEDVQKKSARIALSDATVMVLGETGTGKELLARAIHGSSTRRTGPFVHINCGAIPETLLESELFGYTKGAFTGATPSRKGRIAHAEGGTLFLDEIGEMPLSLQVKLLRLLQDRTHEPIGSSHSVAANFRLIVATNRDLRAEVEAGHFRQDLYYRLLVCQVKLPALRERRGDIGPLFKHFWAQRGEQRQVAASAMALLETHEWPGNVRELENFVERLSVCSEGEVIGVPEMRANFSTGAELGWIDQTATLPPARSSTPARLSPVIAIGVSDATVPCFPLDLPAYIRDLEDRCITAALNQTVGNKRAAAELLGLRRTTLVEKLRRRTVRQSGLAEVELDPTGS